VVNQVALAPLAFEHSALAISTYVRNTLPAPERPDRDLFPLGEVAQEARIVREAAPDGEAAVFVGIGLVGIGHFADSPHGHLRREVEALTHVVVYLFVELVLAERLRLLRTVRDMVARLIGTLQRLKQHLARSSV
jgi:hypothetical protein